MVRLDTHTQLNWEKEIHYSTTFGRDEHFLLAISFPLFSIMQRYDEGTNKRTRKKKQPKRYSEKLVNTLDSTISRDEILYFFLVVAKKKKCIYAVRNKKGSST